MILIFEKGGREDTKPTSAVKERLTRVAYYIIREIIRENTIPISLRKKILNQCVYPVAIYASGRA